MPRRVLRVLAAALALAATVASAGAPARGETARELQGVRFTFPSGLASCPDGAVWVASTYADTLVRIDRGSGVTREVRLPAASQPTALTCDRRGAVWFAGGLGLVGRLDPGGKKPREFALPSLVGARAMLVARALAVHAGRQEMWFTVESDAIVGRVKLDAEPSRRAFIVTELQLGARSIRPYGIAVDGGGAVWVAELGADRLTRIDPVDGSLYRVDLPAGSRPMGATTAPDGSVWVTLLGAGALVRVDPHTRHHRIWTLPAPPSSPMAVAVDGAGVVWTSDVSGNRLLRLDPATERFVSIPLPHPRTGVRALAVDPTGRVWFAGTTSGRVGYVE